MVSLITSIDRKAANPTVTQANKASLRDIRQIPGPDVAAPSVSVSAEAIVEPKGPEHAVATLRSRAKPRMHELAHPISHVLAFAEAAGHRIIGISSDRRGAGVSLVAGELARGYGDLGRQSHLVDASRLVMAPTPPQAANSTTLDLDSHVRTDPNGYRTISLSDLPGSSEFDATRLRTRFESWSAHPGVVVVDLPPIGVHDGIANSTMIKVGSICDVVFLVCLTGIVKSSEFCQCLMQCRAGQLKLGGIILNDWKMTGSKLLSRV